LKLVFRLLLIVLPISSVAQNKKVCISIDDLPTVSYGAGEYEFRLEITEKIIETFRKNDITGIGYVNEIGLYRKGKLDSSEVRLLELWLENGLELGNHTYSHLNYDVVSFEDFTKDLLKGELITKSLAKKHGTEYKYFRHPYLRSGNSKSSSDSLKSFLEEHGYTEAPVTIDNTDYLFAKAYSDAYKKDNKKLMTRIGDSYINYMEEKLVFYERQSNKLFNRNINQILLIHASLLNANYLDELVKMYQNHDYTFVSQTEALADNAYQEEVTEFGNWGISWIDRWAMSKGKKGDFFKGEPKTPEFILELNNN
jgi:peptidoglycan/xylan/chitin deacetylase (PgdA/CDA1 family)